MKIKILQKDAPVLRQVARNVDLKDIRSKKITNLLKNMKGALDAEDDGVAIAAPQIGYSLRIFVVSKKVEEIIKGYTRKEGIPEVKTEVKDIPKA